jgi:L-amino acid N-acyltransferase
MEVLSKPEIREATEADLPRVVAMFSEFVASTQYAQYVGNDPSYSAQQMARMMESDSCALFVVDLDGAVVGMLGVMVFVQPFSGELVASELFWWLDPQHRGNGVWMLRRAEKWAQSKGAARMTMMAPVDKPRVCEIYEAIGYRAVETVFSRNLS